jgi:hypothetical protein
MDTQKWLSIYLDQNQDIKLQYIVKLEPFKKRIKYVIAVLNNGKIETSIISYESILDAENKLIEILSQ